jgi:hypothetical protein
MANEQTKKFNSVSDITSLTDSHRILTQSAGAVNGISLANLQSSILGGLTLGRLMSGIYIMTHRKIDNYPIAWRCEDWTAQQNAGEVADGVLIFEGGKHLVVAPTEASLPWSSASVTGGGVMTTDRVTAINDWAGKANTAAQITKSACSTADYAPGYCAAYERTNANGYGLTAGKWWLPSLGELWMINANVDRINYALSLISGATQLNKSSWYWSSSEYYSNNKWGLYFTYQYMINGSYTGTGHVRPVSAFIS